MSLREYRDRDHIEWRVWTVHPEHVERRVVASDQSVAAERRHGDDGRPRMGVLPRELLSPLPDATGSGPVGARPAQQQWPEIEFTHAGRMVSGETVRRGASVTLVVRVDGHVLTLVRLRDAKRAQLRALILKVVEGARAAGLL